MIELPDNVDTGRTSLFLSIKIHDSHHDKGKALDTIIVTCIAIAIAVWLFAPMKSGGNGHRRGRRRCSCRRPADSTHMGILVFVGIVAAVGVLVLQENGKRLVRLVYRIGRRHGRSGGFGSQYSSIGMADNSNKSCSPSIICRGGSIH